MAQMGRKYVKMVNMTLYLQENIRFRTAKKEEILYDTEIIQQN